jgi:hypothetical protein
VSLGLGVTFNGTLTLNNGSIAFCQCNPTAINSNQGTLTMNTTAVTPGVVSTLTAQNGSQITWNANSTVTNLVLKSGSLLDKSQDSQPMQVTFSSMDDDCIIQDPWNAITFKNATVINGPLFNCLIQTGPGRSLQIV